MSKTKEKVMKIVFLCCALISIAAVGVICFFIFVNGVPAIAEVGFFNFLFESEWKPSQGMYGIFPMLVGSLYVTAGALLVGVPLGVLTAVFLVFFCPERLHKVLYPAVQLLAGIPSVVYGFFGLLVMTPLVRTLFGGSGSSILTASIILGIMILPTIVSLTESALRAVPANYYEGSRGLGATHERSVFCAVMPAAKSGIAAAVVLGIGRAIGETMAVVMIAGNQARVPNSILEGVRTLTANIVMEMGYAADLHRQALIATAAVLFVFILLINLMFAAFKGRSK